MEEKREVFYESPLKYRNAKKNNKNIKIYMYSLANSNKNNQSKQTLR